MWHFHLTPYLGGSWSSQSVKLPPLFHLPLMHTDASIGDRLRTYCSTVPPYMGWHSFFLNIACAQKYTQALTLMNKNINCTQKLIQYSASACMQSSHLFTLPRLIFIPPHCNLRFSLLPVTGRKKLVNHNNFLTAYNKYRWYTGSVVSSVTSQKEGWIRTQLELSCSTHGHVGVLLPGM